MFLLRIKHFIKTHCTGFYIRVRHFLFPFWLTLYTKKVKNFTKKTWKKIQYKGESFYIMIDPENGFIDNTLFVQGMYEEDILSLIQKNVKKGDTYIDIGTNIGLHALFASSCVGDAGKVYAFEPQKRIFDQVEESKKKNHFTFLHIYPYGLSNEEGEYTLSIPKNNKGGASLSPYQKDCIEEIIQLKKGDDVLYDILEEGKQKQGRKVTLIKIDTEGHEYEALLGIEKILRSQHPAIIMEYSPIFWGDAKKGIEMLTFLKNLGYHFFDVEEQNKIYDIAHWVNNFKKYQTNILCKAH